jgi:hypothetical protein
MRPKGGGRKSLRDASPRGGAIGLQTALIGGDEFLLTRAHPYRPTRTAGELLPAPGCAVVY